MVKLSALAILKWNGEQEANLLGMAADLSSYGFFQRTPVRELMTFAARTVAKRTQPGQRQSVQEVRAMRQPAFEQMEAESRFQSTMSYCKFHKLLYDHALQNDFFCHAHNRDGLVGVVFVDKEYPVRSAFCVASKVLDDFMAIHGTKWRAATADSTEANAMLEPALAKYQVLVGWWCPLELNCPGRVSDQVSLPSRYSWPGNWWTPLHSKH